MVVHSVVAQGELLDRHVDNLFQQGAGSEIGLLIGRYAESNRSHLYVLVPTPSNENVDAERSTGAGVVVGGKGRCTGKEVTGSLPSVDPEWIAEHARQVCRLLPGGIQVLGIYVFGTEAVLKELAMMLNSVLCAVCQAISSQFNDSASARITKMPDDFLFLHICSSPKKFTCKTCPFGNGPTPLVGMKLCEMKFGNVLASLKPCTTKYKVDIRLPLISDKSGGRYSLCSAIDAAISKESARLYNALPVVDDAMLADDALVGALFDMQAREGSSYGIEVGFLKPPPGLSYDDSTDSNEIITTTQPTGNIREEVIGMVTIRGMVQGLAYAPVRETVRRAVADLKGDVIKSLRTRLDVLHDELEREQTEEREVSHSVETGTPAGESLPTRAPNALLLSADENGGGLQMAFSSTFPRRVFIPWLDDVMPASIQGVFVSDYLIPGETVQNAMERCEETLAISLGSGAGHMHGFPSEEECGSTVQQSKSLAKEWVPYVVGCDKGSDARKRSRQAAMPLETNKTRDWNGLPCAVVGAVVAVGATALGVLWTSDYR